MPVHNGVRDVGEGDRVEGWVDPPPVVRVLRVVSYHEDGLRSDDPGQRVVHFALRIERRSGPKQRVLRVARVAQHDARPADVQRKAHGTQISSGRANRTDGMRAVDAIRVQKLFRDRRGAAVLVMVVHALLRRLACKLQQRRERLRLHEVRHLEEKQPIEQTAARDGSIGVVVVAHGRAIKVAG